MDISKYLENLNELENEVKSIRRIINDSRTIIDQVNSYEDALIVLNIKSLVKEGNSKDLNAYIKLKVIVKALNEGWVTEYTSYGGNSKWYPDFRFNGNRFEFSSIWCDSNFSSSGAHLSCKTREIAEHLGKNFLDIWNDFLL
jgi:hypothetical protein